MTLEEAIRYRIKSYSKRLADLRAMNPIPREEFAGILARHEVLVAVLEEAGLLKEKP